MLRLKGVSTAAGDRTIIGNVSLDLRLGETLVLFGPNGSGKSTLLRAIMGLSPCRLLGGTIVLGGRDITALPASGRAAAGIGIMFQHPPKIYGVTLRQIAGMLAPDGAALGDLAAALRLEPFLDRDLNVDLSGGETKRAELLQVLLQRPRVLLLDEPESGVDVENISLMGSLLDRYMRESGCATLVITHTGHMLDYIRADRGCVMVGGAVHCAGEPRALLREIRKHGYEKCRECECGTPNAKT